GHASGSNQADRSLARHAETARSLASHVRSPAPSLAADQAGTTARHAHRSLVGLLIVALAPSTCGRKPTHRSARSPPCTGAACPLRARAPLVAWSQIGSHR